ncbi:hypothetical protein ETAA8_57500 [Anatilimnocola aggregata]|uniref:Uncharacterized protein n=1 Tax=Anatilimnocola aggregata TaxID=2528021 RepID=A0A517YK56_9BACT|nr:hypothetical protein [Anatilimnocola aggregata]QDU30604.1 hypothetical protein ETAA8_57500 [Anatilimnocola aggregata]
MNGFTITDVENFTGTPAKTLASWIASRVFIPSIRQANGAGNGAVLCSEHDLLAAGVASGLRRAGASHKTAESACRFIQAMDYSELICDLESRPYLFVGDDDAWLISGEQLADVMQKQNDVLRAFSVFDLSRAYSNLSKLFAGKSAAAVAKADTAKK